MNYPRRKEDLEKIASGIFNWSTPDCINLQDKAQLKTISYELSLSEEVLNKFGSVLDWDGISLNTEKLSDDFIQKNIDKFNLFNLIFTRTQITPSFIEHNIHTFLKAGVSLSTIEFYQYHLPKDILDKCKLILELEK